MSDQNSARKKGGSLTQPEGTCEYVVQKTDTLAGIATQFDTTISVIKKMNRLMSDLVFPSQVLFVPSQDYIPLVSPSFLPKTNSYEDSALAQMPGHAEQPLNMGSAEPLPLPRALSDYEVKKLWEKCDERFIKLHVERILRTQTDPVSGTMIVTPDCVMFDPDPLITCVESGIEKNSVMLEMSDVLSVAVYHNLTVEAVQSRQLADLANTERLNACRLREAAKSAAFVEVESGASVDENCVKVLEAEEHRSNLASVAYVRDGLCPKEVTQLCISTTTDMCLDRSDIPANSLTIETSESTEASDNRCNLTLDELADETSNGVILSMTDECNSDAKAMKGTFSSTSGDICSSRGASMSKSAGIDDELHIYLCIKGINKDKIAMPVRLNNFDKYWFSVPHDKVDQLFAFFIQWSPNVCDDESMQYADEQGFIVVSNSEDHVFSVDDLPPRQSKLCRSTSFSKDWEIINVRELAQRIQDAEVEQLPLPTLSEMSDILAESHVRVFMNHLPARAEGSCWRLVYSTAKHGYSLRTLYRHMTGVDSPVLIVIKDRSGQVFGTMQSQAVKKSDLFYGTGESYLFCFGTEFKKFQWTGINSFFTKGNSDSLCFGASGGINGLWLDGDLYHGRSQHCETYNNEVLSPAEDFTIECLEAWCFN